MKMGFVLEQKHLAPKDAPDSVVQVYAKPSEQEKHELLQNLRLDSSTLDSVLDPDEISRLEISPDRTLIIWKLPLNCSFEQ